MDKVEKIREEIKKRYEYWKEKESNSHSIESESRMSECQHLLLLFNSLQEDPVSNDLEEACDEYYDETWDEHGGKAMVVDGCHDIWFPSQATDDFFKAGAQWQKQQDQSTIELAEDHAYLAGQEQIIDKACEWLENYFKGVPSGTVYLQDFKKAIKEKL